MKNYELIALLKEMPDNFDVILETGNGDASIIDVIKSIQHGKIILDVNKTLSIEST